jgi:Carboxypeptidase regulatory-like domain/TonB dependent receptor
MSRCFARLSLLLCALMMLLVPAWAQYGASLEGTVADKSGAVVPGANVTITNEGTSVSRTTVTSGSGFYRVTALPPGKYNVTVEASSFGKFEAKGVDVTAEKVRGLNVTLAASAEQQTVNVSGELVGLETENANVDGSITSKQVERLPSYGRDPYSLLRLAPGVFGDASLSSNGTANWFPNSPGPGKNDQPGIFQNENFVQATANGQRASGNNFMIDGTSVNSLTWGGAAIITPNQESIQEITVVSSTYSAEDGRNSGAQVKVISKSGTNNLHGSAFFKYDEPGLNAQNQWNGPNDAQTEKVNLKGRDFGGSIGGPILKNKLFFFFSYEGGRIAQTNYSNQWLETPQFDQLIQSTYPNKLIGQAVGIPNNYPRVQQVIPQTDCNAVLGQGYYAPTDGGAPCQVVNGMLDVGSPIGNYGDYAPVFTDPARGGGSYGSGLDGVPDLQQAMIAMPSSSHGNQYNVRVDYNVTSKDLLAFSGYYVPRNDVVATSSGRPAQDLTFQPRNRYGAILWNHTFSPTLLNEARVNATRFFTNQYNTNQQAYWGIPELQIEQIPGNRIQYGATQGTNAPLMAAQNQFEFRDVLSKLFGRHALKVGGSFAMNQDNNDYEFGSQRPIFVYHELWNFFNGAPIYEGINADPRTGMPTDVHKYFRQNDWSLFFQDDWKITPRLTLNVGLRYEFFGSLKEKYGNLNNLYLGSSGPDALTNAVIKTTDQLYPSDKNNFAPRLGFAWTPFADAKTVVRGGVGVSYNRITDTMTGISRVNPPYLFRYGICCGTEATAWGTPYVGGQIDPNVVGTNYQSMYNYGANPVLTNNFDTSTGLPINGQVEIWGAPQNMATPYIWNYSLDIQQELPWNMVFDIGYAGSESRKLLRIVNLDYVYKNGNPHANPVYFPSTSANGNYNALLANLNRRFSNGLQFFAKYRWSKSMDTVSGEGAGAQTNQFWPVNQTWDYGPSDFDSTHNILLTVLYDIPVFKSRHDFIGSVLGGWHVDGTVQYHTGFPWSPVQSNACPTIPQIGGAPCPALVTTQYMQGKNDQSNDALLHGGMFPSAFVSVACTGVDPGSQNTQTNNYTVNQYFQPTTCVAGSDQIEQAPSGPPFFHRNSFRGPNYQTIDLAIGKTARLPWFGGEGAMLDFRANLFNAFNRLNLEPFGYNSSSSAINSNTFGQPSGALAGRVIDFQLRFTF